MQKITFKALGVGIDQFYQAKVQIYNNNCLIKEGLTYNGKITFCLDKNKVYKVITTLNNQKNINIIYTNTNYFVIRLCQCVNRNRLITFLLTDSNYMNLPIKRGELIFG